MERRGAGPGEALCPRDGAGMLAGAAGEQGSPGPHMGPPRLPPPGAAAASPGRGGLPYRLPALCPEPCTGKTAGEGKEEVEMWQQLNLLGEGQVEGATLPGSR